MAKRLAVAIVGAASLLGRELQELLKERKLPVATYLFSGEAADGAINLAEQDGEVAFYEPISKVKLAQADVILLAGPLESSRRAVEVAPKDATIIDLTPYGNDSARGSRVQFVAHPAARALDVLLTGAARAGAIRGAIATIFEPASERGQAGISELQKQTAALLSFQKLPKDVFDAQLAYNLLPSYGEQAPFALALAESRIDRALTRLVEAGGAAYPMPSVRLVQAPVFHGYSFSVWIEFENPVPEGSLVAALVDPRIDFRGADVEPPTNASAAQQSGVIVGSLRKDRHKANGWWLWMACDNLRLPADEAVELVGSLVARLAAATT